MKLDALEHCSKFKANLLENEEHSILLCEVMVQQYCHVNILSNQHLPLAIYRTERKGRGSFWK